LFGSFLKLGVSFLMVMVDLFFFLREAGGLMSYFWRLKGILAANLSKRLIRESSLLTRNASHFPYPVEAIMAMRRQASGFRLCSSKEKVSR